MKKHIFLSVLVACVVAGLAACNRTATTLSGPEVSLKPGVTGVEGMGTLHNVFLANAFSELQKKVGTVGPVLASSSATPEQKTLAAFTAANRLLSDNNLPPMSMEGVESAVEIGREMARNVMASAHQTPDKLVWQALGGEVRVLRTGVSSFTFWEQYREVRGEETTAQRAYDKVSLELGVPVQGSRLATFFDVLLASDVFWSEHYSDGVPNLSKGSDQGPDLINWGKILKFVTLTVVDAGAGGLAAAGGGGVVGGAIVGGLASWGANDILF